MSNFSNVTISPFLSVSPQDFKLLFPIVMQTPYFNYFITLTLRKSVWFPTFIVDRRNPRDWEHDETFVNIDRKRRHRTMDGCSGNCQSEVFSCSCLWAFSHTKSTPVVWTEGEGGANILVNICHQKMDCGSFVACTGYMWPLSMYLSSG